MSYGEDFSPFMNHASHFVPGVEISTGALGHALPIGCGKALAAKSIKNWHTFVILSDGELQEGSNWEAFMFAAHYSLSQLTVIIDFNNLQSLTMLRTFFVSSQSKVGIIWMACNSIDGHCHQRLLLALEESKLCKSPVAIIMNNQG